jgi:hypothetical protein
MGLHRMATDGIDEERGIVDVYKLLPEQGDSIMIVNCGDHFEVRHHKWSVQSVPPIELTPYDIECLKQGLITWN